MSENPILMTQAEYARHRNKSPQYIGKLYKAAILVIRGAWWTRRCPAPCSTTSPPRRPRWTENRRLSSELAALGGAG